MGKKNEYDEINYFLLINLVLFASASNQFWFYLLLLLLSILALFAAASTIHIIFFVPCVSIVNTW